MIELAVLQNKPLTAILRHINGEDYSSNIELFERGKTIFFPGDPADKIYFLLKGAVKLSLVYEAGDEITVALLRENSVFGLFSLIAGQKSDRLYHAVAFSAVELLSAPTNRVEEALKNNSDLSILMLKGLSSRILQTEMMIETLAHRDMGSRLVSFLLILCRDFGVPVSDCIHIDLKLSHQAIAEAIGSTRVTITRLLGDLRQQGIISIYKKKITVHNPINLSQQFS